jgi:hypothetical protein
MSSALRLETRAAVVRVDEFAVCWLLRDLLALVRLVQGKFAVVVFFVAGLSRVRVAGVFEAWLGVGIVLIRVAWRHDFTYVHAYIYIYL